LIDEFPLRTTTEVDMTSTLKDTWNRLLGKRTAVAVEHEVEAEQMSPEERHFVGESIDGKQADVAAAEHLGGVDPARLISDEAPPS
jgi:hypothetical protein